MASPTTPPPTLGFLQESTPSLDHKEEKEPASPEQYALHSSKARFWVNVIIISAYVAALVLAIVHHIFLWRFHGQDATYYTMDQRQWVSRASNLLSKIIATSLAVVVVTALIQGVWNTITSEYTPVGVVDDLFSLPSPVAVVSLLYKYPKLKLVPLVCIAVLIQALTLVGVLAPGALLVDRKLETRRNIPIPKLDFETLATHTDILWWEDVAQHYIINNANESWTVPPECDRGCQFTIEYQAPGISCRQMSEQETPLKAFDLQVYERERKWDFYLSNWSSDMLWGTNSLPLNFSFVPMISQISGNTLVSVNQTDPIQGQLCKFQDSTYRAHFKYANNVKSSVVEVLSETNEFAQNCSWTSGTSQSSYCSHYATAATNLSLGFTENFSGTASWVDGKKISTWQQLSIMHLFNYEVDAKVQTTSLSPKEDLGTSVENTFANVVLGVLLRLNHTERSDELVVVEPAWYFHWPTLWLVYGPALLLVLVAGLYGLRWTRQADIVRENKFSSFLIATRTKDLDGQHPGVITSTKLRYDAQTGRFVVSNDEKPTSDPDETTTHTWTRSIILISLLLGILFVLGHHFFLYAMQDTDASTDDRQFWIKGANNAFSQAVSICLGTAAAYSLTQASWHALKLHGGSVEAIDSFFSLPSPPSVIALLKKARKIQITYLIIIAVLIQALGLVTTFAPGALTTGFPPWNTTNLTVPTLNLSADHYAVSDLYADFWDDYIAQLEQKSPEDNWSVPAGCGDTCSFKVQYEAPALSCRDMSADEYTVKAYDSSASSGNWTFYDFNSTRFSQDMDWNANNHPFIFNYVSMNFTSNPPEMVWSKPPTGSICQCKDGTYEANFNYANNTITLNTTILSYRNAYTSNCTEGDPNVASSECKLYKNNSIQTCIDFTKKLSGAMTLDLAKGTGNDGTHSPLIVEELADYSINYDGNGTIYFEPRFKNLSEGLTSFFSNLTVSLLPALNLTADVPVRVRENRQVWKYESTALFAAYAPALAAVLAIAAYGLYCIHANGRAMDSKFSTVLLTTRNGELDGVYEGADNFDSLMGKKLVYAKRGYFVPNAQDPSPDLAKEA